MSETHPPRRIGRSVGALLAGFLTVVILSLGTDALLYATAVFPPFGQRVADPLLLLATSYRSIYGIAGAYIVARLAPNRPMQHALVSGLIGLIVSIVGAVATWNAGPAYDPKWYPLALIATTMPCAWAGGKLAGFKR